MVPGFFFISMGTLNTTGSMSWKIQTAPAGSLDSFLIVVLIIVMQFHYYYFMLHHSWYPRVFTVLILAGSGEGFVHVRLRIQIIYAKLCIRVGISSAGQVCRSRTCSQFCDRCILFWCDPEVKREKTTTHISCFCWKMHKKQGKQTKQWKNSEIKGNHIDQKIKKQTMNS